jgi:hypothetical protein
MPIEIDLQWPFIFNRFDGHQTLAELDAYIKRMDDIHAQRKPYVGVSFLKKYNRDHDQVERIRKWMKDCEQATRDYCFASGIVSQSGGFRFLLGAIFLFKPMPCPHDVCGTFDEAVKFVKGHADKRGLVLPVPRKPWDDMP